MGVVSPLKAIWLWSCTACIVATIVVGFAWGGWVTGGTATRMASDAADGAQARLASASCVIRFNQGSDAVAQLAALKKANSYERGDIIKKGGWGDDARRNEAGGRRRGYLCSDANDRKPAAGS